MKKLQNNFTTPEQSKRLLELGVPADSADCYYTKEEIEGYKYWFDLHIKREYQPHTSLHSSTIYREILPCWSVGRLVEMWEICVGVKFDRWSRKGVLLPLIEDCMEHIEFALNPYTKVELDFSKLEE